MALGVHFVHFRVHFDTHFGPFLNPSRLRRPWGTTWRPQRDKARVQDPFMVPLGSFWAPFWDPFWDHFWTVSMSIFLKRFAVHPGCLPGWIWGAFWEPFWIKKWSKLDPKTGLARGRAQDCVFGQNLVRKGPRATSKLVKRHKFFYVFFGNSPSRRGTPRRVRE